MMHNFYAGIIQTTIIRTNAYNVFLYLKYQFMHFISTHAGSRVQDKVDFLYYLLELRTTISKTGQYVWKEPQQEVKVRSQSTETHTGQLNKSLRFVCRPKQKVTIFIETSACLIHMA